MKQKEQRNRRRLPLWAMLLADTLLLAVGLCGFAYFHHVRDFWGSGGNRVLQSIAPPAETADFGASFPGVFAPAGQMEVTSDGYRSENVSLTLRQVDTEMEGGAVRYFVYDVYVRQVENLYTVCSVGGRESVEALVERTAQQRGEPSVAAVNGDYMGNRNRTLVAVRNGDVLRRSDFILADLCVLSYDGTMTVIKPGEYDWDALLRMEPYQVWNFGPGLLTAEGAARTSFSKETSDQYVIAYQHPRTAIGYYEPGHYCLVVVDGRSDVSVGVTMESLAEIMASLGCRTAYNLDGGDSAQAYFAGRMIRVDQGREASGEGQRALWDMICVGEPAKPASGKKGETT